MVLISAIFYAWKIVNIHASGYSSGLVIKTSCKNMNLRFTVILLTLCCSFAARSETLDSALDKFDAIYQNQLGNTRGCQSPEENTFRVCSDALKNAGNAPFILHHNKPTDKVVVLFHGLSDSPFFFKSIAQAIHQQGHNVVVALTPGHGKKQADEDMQDENLSDRWRSHVVEIMDFSASLGDKKYIGGFSTGGTLAAEYSLQNPKIVSGLLLFSGALALDSTVESMSSIWGIKWLSKFLDGDYEAIGANPYKYPSVARFSAFELIEVIFSVRELLEQGKELNLPIFAAHSAADVTTPISGVKDLMAANKGANALFEMAKADDVCHADVVISEAQLLEMQYDASGIEEVIPCDVPRANPKHAEMLASMQQFLSGY
jgi:pimeloyl-ACP methyl ester carboxylesterase